MADQNEGVPENATVRRTLADYVKPSLKDAQPSVIRPTVDASNFTIPPQIITMIQNSVQFEGMPEEDPNAHVALFLEVCDTFKIDGASDNAIKLRLFPFSLRGRAKSWLNALSPGSITTWKDMAEKFLFRYFPPSKTALLKNKIHAFLQDDEESLYEAWERFKELLRKCPHHGLELWQQVHTFYNALNTPTRQIVDITAGGSLNTKTPKEAFNLFEELAMNNYEWPNTRSRASKERLGVHQIDSNKVLSAHVEALSSKIDRLLMENFQGSEIFEGANVSATCQNRGTFNSHDYVKVVEGHGTRSKQPSGQSTWSFSHPNKKPEETISHDSEDQKLHIKKVIEGIEDHLDKLKMFLKKSGIPLSFMKNNPNEHVNAVTIRSNRAVQEDKSTCTSKRTIEEIETESPSKMQNNRLSPASITRSKELLKEYKHPPGRFEKEKSEEQHGKFLEPYTQLHINLPLVDALGKMPKYTMFLKDLLTNKKNLEELSTVTMNEECSAILQNKLPQKITDPGSFTIPCLIGCLWFNNALADLGASINLMPYSVFVKLDLGEPKPTHMRLQLADRSLKYPRGVVENMLVKIDRFVFPVDFVILDMEEDENVPLIFGRPFLATSRALIDVFDGKLTLRVDDETVTFNIKNSMRHTQGHDSLYFINTIMLHVGRCFREICGNDTLSTQILGRLNGKIKLSTSVIELKTTPLASKSPQRLNLFEVIKKQESKAKSVIEPPSLKLKEFPSHPKCALPNDDSKLPVIFAKDLTVEEGEKHLTMLKKHKKIYYMEDYGYQGYRPFNLHS